MKIFFSAGEASGDLHAAQVIREIRALDPSAQIQFLGGDCMAEACGHGPIIHYRDMAYMGFIDVARHLPQVLGNLDKAKRILREWRPDALVLVDYPGFNLKLAEYAKTLGIKVHYYIAPKLWAWKEYRIKQIRKNVDRLYSILPFEPEWFGERGVRAEYVGNPSVEEILPLLKEFSAEGRREQFLRKHNLQEDRPILALVPGSRVGEIKANLPVMAEAARMHPELQPVIAGAPGIDRSLYRGLTDIRVVDASTLELMKYSQAALVTSGTASLECALVGTPQVVCYRAVGWKLAHDLFTHILKIPYVSLPNLVAGKITAEECKRVNAAARKSGVRGCVVPELLVHNCTAATISRELSPLIPKGFARSKQLEGCVEVYKRLNAAHTPARTVAENILQG